jgi:PAS domain S-box-containing protein
MAERHLLMQQGGSGAPSPPRAAPGSDIYDLIHDLDAIIWELDVARRQFTFVSQRAEELLGYPLERWLHEPGFWASQVVHPDDRPWVVERCLHVRDMGSEHRMEYRAVTAAGRVLWLRHVSRLVSHGHGGPQRRGVIFDITEQKRAEAALRESEGRYRSLIENISDIVAVVGACQTLRYISPSTERVLGYTAGEALGRSPLDFVHPEDATYLARRTASRLRGEADPIQLTEVRFRHRDGSWRILQVRGRWHDQGPGESVVVLTARDVTERRHSEEALRRQSAYFARLFEDAPEAIVILDEADRVQRVNEEFSRLFGYVPEEAVGGTINDLVVPEEMRAEASSLSLRAARGERVGIETVRRRRDGVLVHVSILAVPVEFEDGTVRIYGIYRDVSARKQAEEALAESKEQLRQAQKMEAVGRLAGGVAHDFNNVLTAIQGHAQLLLDALSASDPRRGDAAEIWRSAERAAGLTRQLLAFSRKQILKPEAVDLNAIVSGLEKMLRQLLGEEIHFEAALPHGLGRVLADPGQVEQLLMNLVVNARDAMPGGGDLTIETENAELDEDDTGRFAYPVEPGHYVLLTVRDTGMGMAPAVREQIFEPFFTTKEQGKGTGLGLSTVYGIVKQSGGHIRVESREGEGTTFRIYLPLLEAAEAAPEPASERAGGASASYAGTWLGTGPDTAIVTGTGTGFGSEAGPSAETVLVVEDDTAVRMLTCKVLERHGYRVAAATNGAEALRLIAAYPDPIQLVITDVVMPELGGTELAARLRRMYPELAFLFMSGYTEDELVRRGVADGQMLLLEKPFSPATLKRRVREALARVPRERQIV